MAETLEPVWLVRLVLALALVGFAAFIVLEGDRFLDSLPWGR